MDGLFCLFVCLSGLADDPSFGLVLNTTFGSGHHSVLLEVQRRRFWNSSHPGTNDHLLDLN